MTRRLAHLAIAALLAATSAGCASMSRGSAEDVQAVVGDEKARAAAASVARTTGESEDGVAVADDAAARETTPK